MTTSRTPAFRRRQVSWTMRQHLTRLVTCSMRTRRRAMRRVVAFCARQGTASRLPGRHEDLDRLQGEGQEAPILAQPTARRHGGGGGIGHPLVMGPARVGLAPQEDRERVVEQEHGFSCVVFFLAAITPRLLSQILGALDAPFGPIGAQRGAAGARAGAAAGSAAVGGDSAVGTTMAAASTSATPRRVANAV